MHARSPHNTNVIAISILMYVMHNIMMKSYNHFNQNQTYGMGIVVVVRSGRVVLLLYLV